MLASTIQFTTNPPTPTQEPPQPGAPDESGNQGALPQNPDSMPPPHTNARGGTHHHPTGQQRACFLHQSPDKPTTRERQASRDTVNCPALPQGQTP